MSLMTVSDFITKAYSIKKRNTITDVFDMLRSMNKIGPLSVLLNQYFNVPRDQEDLVETKYAVEGIINKYANDEIIVPELGIIVDSIADTDIVFVLGLLEFQYNVHRFNPISSPELSDILTDDDTEAVHKIGLLVNYYQPDFYAIDAYDILTYVSDSTIDRYIDIVDSVISNAETDAGAITDIVNKLLEVDQTLIGTKLVTYILTNNAYHMTDKQVITYINNIVQTTNMSDIELANILIAFSILNGVALEDIIELVNTLYEDFDTVSIVNRVTSAVRSRDEHQS